MAIICEKVFSFAALINLIPIDYCATTADLPPPLIKEKQIYYIAH